MKKVNCSYYNSWFIIFGAVFALAKYIFKSVCTKGFFVSGPSPVPASPLSPPLPAAVSSHPIGYSPPL